MMRCAKPLMLFMVACFCGCIPNRGPKTNAFFKAYQTEVKSLESSLENLPPIAAPQAPTLAKHSHQRLEEIKEAGDAQRRYHAELLQYYDAISARYQLLSRMALQAQARIAALDTAGIDPDSIKVITLYEQALGQFGKCFLSLSHLAVMQHEALRNKNSDQTMGLLILDVIIGGSKLGVPGAMLGAFKEVLKNAKQKMDEKDAIAEQLRQISDAEVQISQGVVDYKTAYAQLQTSLSARYPDQDWSMMAVSTAAKEESR